MEGGEIFEVGLDLFLCTLWHEKTDTLLTLLIHLCSEFQHNMISLILSILSGIPYFCFSSERGVCTNAFLLYVCMYSSRGPGLMSRSILDLSVHLVHRGGDSQSEKRLPSTCNLSRQSALGILSLPSEVEFQGGLPALLAFMLSLWGANA